MKTARIYIIIIIALLAGVKEPFAQYIPEHISNTAIYTYLDELSSLGIIEINQAVKPYSKSYIAGKLQQASLSESKLSHRQQKELEFYLQSYRPELTSGDKLQWPDRLNIFKKYPHIATSPNPLGFHYKDSLFTFSIRPVYSIEFRSNANGTMKHTFGGLDAYGTIDKHWGIYASLRDNYMTQILAFPGYFTTEPGGNYKINEGGRQGGDYSEMRAGITYAWKWGDVGLVKDHFTWGTNYHGSNIFSGRTPSFAQFRLHMYPAKWIELNYIHGWLVSEVIDSSRIYSNVDRKRLPYKPKFLAANFITVTPFKNLNISVGNSIVYCDLEGIHPAYLIPVAFYKSIDHTLNHGTDNQNSQMYLDVSSKQIKFLHLYGSLFIDEFSIKRIWSKKEHNFFSIKGGFNLSDFPFRDISLTAEFTRTSPITYKHYVAAATFASNKFNLGHYLGDNSQEIYLAITFKPVARLRGMISYTKAIHGGEYAYTHDPDLTTHPWLTNLSWSSSIFEISAQYQFVNNAYLYVSYNYGNVEGFDLDGNTAQYYLNLFTPAFYQGRTNTISLGFAVGF